MISESSSRRYVCLCAILASWNLLEPNVCFFSQYIQKLKYVPHVDSYCLFSVFHVLLRVECDPVGTKLFAYYNLYKIGTKYVSNHENTFAVIFC